MILHKKEIDRMLSTRYIEGYSEYDRQYRDLVKNFIIVQYQSDLFGEMQNMLGEFNAIIKKIYEDVISQLYRIQYRRYPLMQDICEIIINRSIPATLWQHI